MYEADKYKSSKLLTISQFEKICRSVKYKKFTFNNKAAFDGINGLTSCMTCMLVSDKVIFMRAPDRVGFSIGKYGCVCLSNIEYIEDDRSGERFWDEYTIICHNPESNAREKYTVMAEQ